MTESVHLLISGRVQGVGFRAATLQQAQKHGLTGWVANCRDGSVEVYAEGEANELTAFKNWLRTGPPSARVDQLTTLDPLPLEETHNFEIR